MKTYLIIAACLVAVGGITYLIVKKPSVIKSALYGIAGLLAVNISSIFTGVGIGINLLTVSFCLVLGLPGVILMLILKLL